MKLATLLLLALPSAHIVAEETRPSRERNVPSPPTRARVNDFERLAEKLRRSTLDQTRAEPTVDTGSAHIQSRDYFAELLAKAERGDAESQFAVAVRYADGAGNGKGPEEAVKWYRKAAERKHADAEFWLGVRYAYGEGVTKDPEEAVKWYRRAAEQKHADAEFRLGVSYALGEGVGKDSAEALKWFLQAAEQGNAESQYRLGLMYEDGESVDTDPKKAAQWYRKAAEQGEEIGRASCRERVCYPV